MFRIKFLFWWKNFFLKIFIKNATPGNLRQQSGQKTQQSNILLYFLYKKYDQNFKTLFCKSRRTFKNHISPRRLERSILLKTWFFKSQQAKKHCKNKILLCFLCKNRTKNPKLYFAKVEGLLKIWGLHDVYNALFSSKRDFSD